MAVLLLALSTIAYFRVALLPAIGADLALRPGLLSLVTVVFGVGRVLADMPAGAVADRISPLRALAASATGLVLGSLLLAAAHSLAALLVASMVLGLSSSTTNTTGMTFFSHGPAEHRGKSLAAFSAALLGGQALGPAVSGLLSGIHGWRATEVGGAVAAALVALACLSPQLGRSRRAQAVAGRAERAARGSVATPAIDPAQRALLYLVSFAVFFALAALPQTLLPLIGADHYRLGAGVVGLLLGVGGICRFGGAAGGGVVADRYSRKAALVPALLAMGGGAALLELPGGPVVWVSSIVLLSLGSFGVTVAATMLADHGGGVRVGRRLGVFRFVGDFGLVAGPLAAGWLYDGLGTGAAVAAVGGLLGACAIVAAVGLDETRHLHAPVAVDVAAG